MVRRRSESGICKHLVHFAVCRHSSSESSQHSTESPSGENLACCGSGLHFSGFRLRRPRAVG